MHSISFHLIHFQSAWKEIEQHNIGTCIEIFQDVLNFGRSGAGAPVRGSDGQVRAVVMGNPEIR